MKKKLTKLLLIALSVAVIAPQSIITAKANTTSNSQIALSDATKELIQKFPSVKGALAKYSNGKIASRTRTYLKFTPKTTHLKKVYTTKEDLQKDIEVKEYTQAQYEQEQRSESLFGQIKNIGPVVREDCSWLNLDLQIYYGNSSSEFLVYNYCSWIKRPHFLFTDAIGISVSSGMVLGGDSNSRHAEYEYYNPYDPEGLGIQTAQPEVSDNVNGIMAKFKLAEQPGGQTSPKEFHNMMLQAIVKFSGKGTDSGTIVGTYMHSEAGIGSISLGATGIPSASGVLIVDKTKAYANVSKWV